MAAADQVEGEARGEFEDGLVDVGEDSFRGLVDTLHHCQDHLVLRVFHRQGHHVLVGYLVGSLEQTGVYSVVFYLLDVQHLPRLDHLACDAFREGETTDHAGLGVVDTPELLLLHVCHVEIDVLTL